MRLIVYSATIIRRIYEDNIHTTNESSKKPTRRGNNNENQEAILISDIKDQMDKAVTELRIDDGPTRSDE
jgi:hypothetical protein